MTKEKRQKAQQLEDRIERLEEQLGFYQKSEKINSVTLLGKDNQYVNNGGGAIDHNFVQWDVVKVLAINAIQAELDAKKAEYEAL